MLTGIIKCIPQRCLICGAMLLPNSKDTHRCKRMYKQMADNRNRVVQSKVNIHSFISIYLIIHHPKPENRRYTRFTRRVYGCDCLVRRQWFMQMYDWFRFDYSFCAVVRRKSCSECASCFVFGNNLHTMVAFATSSTWARRNERRHTMKLLLRERLSLAHTPDSAISRWIISLKQNLNVAARARIFNL